MAQVRSFRGTSAAHSHTLWRSSRIRDRLSSHTEGQDSRRGLDLLGRPVPSPRCCRGFSGHCNLDGRPARLHLAHQLRVPTDHRSLAHQSVQQLRRNLHAQKQGKRSCTRDCPKRRTWYQGCPPPRRFVGDGHASLGDYGYCAGFSHHSLPKRNSILSASSSDFFCLSLIGVTALVKRPPFRNRPRRRRLSMGIVVPKSLSSFFS